MNDQNPHLSVGEERVRVKFNPSEIDIVNVIKQKTAELINLCEELTKIKEFDSEKSLETMVKNMEIQRLVAQAQSSYEIGAMWAVKAATVQ